jgi:hypothetical protein
MEIRCLGKPIDERANGRSTEAILPNEGRRKMAYIDQLIMFCAGVWMTAAGFGYFATGARQDWLVQIVGQFRWAGPLLIGIRSFCSSLHRCGA